MRLIEVTAPTSEPLTTEAARNHMRVDINEEDVTVDAYIKAARKWCERYTGKAFITQTWDLYLDEWPASPVYLPLPPLQSVTSWKYTDDDGNESTWASSNYIVSTGTPGRITVVSDASLPTVTLQEADAVVIRFVCGYGDDPDDVDEQARQAVRMLAGHFYENREPMLIGTSAQELEFTVKSLLYPVRDWSRAHARWSS